MNRLYAGQTDCDTGNQVFTYQYLVVVREPLYPLYLGHYTGAILEVQYRYVTCYP